MKKILPLIPIFLLLVLWSSCRKDFEYDTNTGNLTFSKDTVYLDTIFSTIGSSTYSLTVYNKSNTDINIPSITLENGINSSYRLNVDGIAGTTFNNIPLLAKDSLFIFIETTFNISNVNKNEFLYIDALLFEATGKNQRVPLVTLVKDAIFLYPSKLANGSNEKVILEVNEDGEEISVDGFLLNNEQLNFTDEKPYVIYGYASVPKDKIVTIAAGTRIHFHENSGIFVKEGATININGELSTNKDTLENEVIFEGDRLEPEFANVSGQWGTLWLAKGSINNTINYLTIKNATVGIYVTGNKTLTSPTLLIKNTQIHNSQEINLWAKTAIINGENLVLGAAKKASLYCNLGGSYSFTHTTIANYWNSSFRENSALQIDNFKTLKNETLLTKDLIQANFTNCIIYGNNISELFLNSNTTKTFNFNFSNCLLKNIENNNSTPYNYSDINFYENILLNKDPDFIAIEKNNFKIGDKSAAINKGNIEAAILVPTDILGTSRIENPSIGAYQLSIE